MPIGSDNFTVLTETTAAGRYRPRKDLPCAADLPTNRIGRRKDFTVSSSEQTYVIISVRIESHRGFRWKNAGFAEVQRLCTYTTSPSVLHVISFRETIAQY